MTLDRPVHAPEAADGRRRTSTRRGPPSRRLAAPAASLGKSCPPCTRSPSSQTARPAGAGRRGPLVNGANAGGGANRIAHPREQRRASRNERVDLDGNDHAQLFHTGAANGDWVLTSLIVVSEDSQGDDFDVDICEAHNSTEFPTSSASTPCTRLSRPSSFAAGHLQFTAPGAGIGLNDNDNYVAVFKQSGNEDVSLDATTSAGEDSGLSGWSIKNRFDWKDGNTWKHKGGSSNEAILIRQWL